MRRIFKTLVVGGASGALLLSGCGLGEKEDEVEDVGAGSQVDPEALQGVEVTVGSKEFDEQLLLGQLTLLMLNAAGAEVTDGTGTTGSEATRQALIQGDTDVYWDYTGTGWVTYLRQDEVISDPQELYEAVRDMDLQENNVVWGEPAPFNNTYAFGTTQEFSEENGLETLSDMAAYINDNPDSSVCVASEFVDRPDGLPGVESTYGMDISNLKNLGDASGAIYAQIDDGGCDFGEIFTTDGRIQNLDLKVLEDDKAFFPLYNGTPVVMRETNEANPEILEVLAPLAQVLDNETMVELNGQVAEGLPPEQVAEDFLREQDFIQ
ncbi:MAG: glycine betaine ABC transporter substrate-binding protein [Nocardioidaceae bacterium]